MNFYSIPVSMQQLIPIEEDRAVSTEETSKYREHGQLQMPMKAEWVDAENSVRQHIHLMLYSNLGSYGPSPGFGCALSQFDFYMPDADQYLDRFNSLFRSASKAKRSWYEKVLLVITESLERSIELHEPRLKRKKDELGQENLFVSIQNKNSSDRRFRASIIVDGYLQEKDFNFQQDIVLPLKPNSET